MMRLLAGALALFALGAFAQAPLAPAPIAARSYFVLDTLSGQPLAAASENDRFEPGSLTKLMSAYVVFTALRDKRLDAMRPIAVSADAAAAPGTRMFLVAGRAATVGDLLGGMIVLSANDATMALAEAVAGSESAFVAAMNAQAGRMSLANTRFANATGAPAEGHYASARDLAMLTAALVRDFPDHYPLYSRREFTFERMSQGNRNRLLWTDATVDGLTAGFTPKAGYSLAASARRGERRLVSVLMGAQSDALRTSETQRLLNFGFQAYDTRRLYKRGEVVATPEVFKGIRKDAPLGFDRDVWLTLPRDRFDGLSATLETRQPFVAPLAAGQKAGIMKLMRGHATVAEFPVVALEEVPVAGFLSRGWDTLRLLVRPTP